MSKWTRWQGWVAFLAGAYAALSPLWTETTTRATWTMVVLGVMVAAMALWSMAQADSRSADYALVLLGVLFIVSPWVMVFAQIDAMALTAWIVGAVTVVVGVLGVPQVEESMHMRHHRPIPH